MTEDDGMITQIRPRGFGLMPFVPPVIALPLVFTYAAWAHARSDAERWAVVATVVLTTGALAVWTVTYHWRARIIVNSADRTLEIRGILFSRTIKGRDIRSAVLYGPRYNQAVAYMDHRDRRRLTLHLGYWSLADLRRINDRLEVELNEWEKPRISPPGKGLLPFEERHPLLGGAALFLLGSFVIGSVWAAWSWWFH